MLRMSGYVRTMMNSREALFNFSDSWFVLLWKLKNELATIIYIYISGYENADTYFVDYFIP